MPFVLSRKVRARLDETPKRLGEYSRLRDAASALAETLKTYPEYGSDEAAQCWWAKDKLGRIYQVEVTREPPSSTRLMGPRNAPCEEAGR